jgi:hypothetical protein
MPTIGIEIGQTYTFVQASKPANEHAAVRASFIAPDCS